MKPATARYGILSLLLGALAVGAGCASSNSPGTTEEPVAVEAVADADVGADLPSLEGEPTLDEYLTYAGRNNPGLRAAFNRWEAALDLVPQAKSLPDPKLSYTNYVEEVETRVGPQRWNVSLAQTFPWFGKLSLRGRMALEAAHAARQHYEAARLRLLFEFKRAYYEYYYLGRAVAVTEENVQLLGDLGDVALAQYRAGAVPHSAVIRAQIELAKGQDRLSTLRDMREPLVADLNAALGRPPDAPLPWPKELPAETADVTSEKLLEWLERNNPELKALDFATAKENAAVALARKDRYPDITLGVTYIETDEAIMAGTDDSGKDPVLAMLSINLPLWAGKYRAAEREARARLDAALSERENRRNALAADVKMAWYSLHDAARKITLYKETLIPQADQGLKVTQQAFKTGKADFLDLIDAQQTLLELQLLYERVRVNRARRLAELEMLVGRPILQPEPAAEEELKEDPRTFE